jgi:hypothetical protein
VFRETDSAAFSACTAAAARAGSGAGIGAAGQLQGAIGVVRLGAMRVPPNASLKTYIMQLVWRFLKVVEIERTARQEAPAVPSSSQ